VNDTVNFVPGGKVGPVDKAINDRFHQDSNDTPGTYSNYLTQGAATEGVSSLFR